LYQLFTMAEKDIEYRVAGAADSPDPYEVSAGNKEEVGNSNLAIVIRR
jgi:hypothetical protein